jgi:hypothetical protein
VWSGLTQRSVASVARLTEENGGSRELVYACVRGPEIVVRGADGRDSPRGRSIGDEERLRGDGHTAN